MIFHEFCREKNLIENENENENKNYSNDNNKHENIKKMLEEQQSSMLKMMYSLICK